MTIREMSDDRLIHLAALYDTNHKGIRSLDEFFLNGEDKEVRSIWFDFFKERNRKTFAFKPFVRYDIPKIERSNFLGHFGNYIKKGPLFMQISEDEEFDFFSTAYFVPNFITMMTRIRKGKYSRYRYGLDQLRPNTFVHTGLNVSEGEGDAIIEPFQMTAFGSCLEKRYSKNLSPLTVETMDYKFFPISVGSTHFVEARIDQIINQLFNQYYSEYHVGGELAS